MIDWTDEAIEAAHKMLPNKHLIGRRDVRPALDAAVKAQGIGPLKLTSILAWEAGRFSGLEEAATVCEGDFDSEMRAYGKAFATAIRARKGETP